MKNAVSAIGASAIVAISTTALGAGEMGVQADSPPKQGQQRVPLTDQQRQALMILLQSGAMTLSSDGSAKTDATVIEQLRKDGLIEQSPYIPTASVCRDP